MDIKETGYLGEKLVCEYLISKKCVIVTTNYHSRFGEIDIIAKNEKNLLFVEVKTRKNNFYADGLSAINTSKINKIIKTAQDFLYKTQCEFTDYNIRFDAAIVSTNGNKNYKLWNISYIKNAFDLNNISNYMGDLYE